MCADQVCKFNSRAGTPVPPRKSTARPSPHNEILIRKSCPEKTFQATTTLESLFGQLERRRLVGFEHACHRDADTPRMVKKHRKNCTCCGTGIKSHVSLYSVMTLDHSLHNPNRQFGAILCAAFFRIH